MTDIVLTIAVVSLIVSLLVALGCLALLACVGATHNRRREIANHHITNHANGSQP